MDRPSWFVCGKCLFFEFDVITNKDTDGNCFHTSNLRREDSQTGFCENWTCRNCWQTWEDYHFYDEDGHINDPQYYTDHSKCKAVRFGNER